ncbi:helix-turn-helix domain-containing protein [Parafilimonas terrae]|uniref:DNA-binding transcriptional regulator, XRE-family HTH domain n=1 Tax=Parafilimonas terrae TaxID=1465490 RepID=A0A1I5XH06_9BACT|nr:helix-turn-helix transcriptional regulator [Parafilimonas terrae]SFQ31258.1 DNA-binding transcriptional regulator, XRE-family HTH domain [Parafilimonas terrae]
MAAANKIHEGHNVKRIREILGIKQDALAIDLEITQQAVSLLEQKETIDAPTLDKVAKALGVTADAIRNFNEEATFNIISNNYHDHSSSVNYQFNSIEKIVELYQQKMELYERMLKEKNELIDKLMQNK